MKFFVPRILAAAMTLVLAGCIHYQQDSHINPPTLGQELRDLQKAFDSGAIDADTYEQKRASLLHSDSRRGRSHQHH